ncbi:MAG: type II toxin-antitoxin system HicB family antitoxin [Candidatus Taylorbacteria bacterium]|nr:type II toxin-antitoxin system HicB family antitoxin [Candidatus Taylorbacteria bacterium]
MNNDIIFSMGTHTYVAKIKKDKRDNIYTVNFPTLKGCITYGRTLEKAITMAKDALELYLSGIRDDKESFPIEKSSLHLKESSTVNIPLTVTV